MTMKQHHSRDATVNTDGSIRFTFRNGIEI